MDERGFVAVSFIEAVDDANAVALEPLERCRGSPSILSDRW